MLDDQVLVTGSNGFIGTRVVKLLLEYGFSRVRCLVRPSSHLDRLRGVIAASPRGKDVEMITGDLLSPPDCVAAAENVAIVFHLAAGFDKSFAGAFMNSALATRNLMDAFLKCGRPKRFVSVSSFAVYSNLQMKRGSLLDENCPLDTPRERSDPYGFGKLKQEQLVRQYGDVFKLPFVIIRPGVVFGPGKRDLSGRIGTSAFGRLMTVRGSNVLPLTYVDNCAEAIVLAGTTTGIEGEAFNVVDDTLPTNKQFLRAYKKTWKHVRSVPVPYWLAYWFSAVWEDRAKRSQNQLPPAFNRRRCSAEWKGNRYTNEKLRQRLGWTPKIDLASAMSRFLEQTEVKPSG